MPKVLALNWSNFRFMHKNLAYLNIIVILVFFNSCNHNLIDSDAEDPCILPAVSDNNGLGYSIEYNSVMYHTPSVNPNDSNQFIYIEARPYESVNDLVRYDISTGDKVVLANNVDNFPKWGKNNFIVFSKFGQLWKIKSNGDSLSLLYGQGANSNFAINPRGDKIIFKHTNDGFESIFICDLSGEILDSLSNTSFSLGAWSPDGLKVFTNSPYYVDGAFTYGYYDSTLTNFVELLHIISSKPFDVVSYAEWFNDSENLLWFGSGVNNYLNIFSKTSFVFADYCQKNYNLYPTISANSNRIFWEKQQTRVLESGDGWYKWTSIVMTDLSGDNEITILQ